MKPVIEVAAGRSSQRLNPVVVHQRLAVSTVATFAMDLLKTHLTYPVIPHLNTQHGAVYELMSESRIVERCVTIAEIAFSEFQKRGWVENIPTLDELKEEVEPAGFMR